METIIYVVTIGSLFVYAIGKLGYWAGKYAYYMTL